MLRHLISFLFLFLLINLTSTSQTLISENFSGSSLPSEWSIQSASSNEFTWTFQDDYDDVEVYESKATAQNEWLILPAMDLSACSNLTFNFELWLFGKSSFAVSKSAEVKIKVTADNGASWDEVWNSASLSDTEFSGDFNFDKKRAVSLASYCGLGMENVQIAFQFISTGFGASATAFAALINADAIAEYPKTYVPDDNFEQALIDLGYDSGPLDDYVLTGKISGILNLNVSGRNINSLNGIEDFISLVHLDCTLNNLSQLNVSKNAALTYLVCGNNQLTSIDLSNNLKLKELLCWNNKLTSLDVSKNSVLTLLECSTNNIEALDISNNLLLEALYCRTNQLSILDLSKNNMLGRLDCGNNMLVSVNLKNGENDKLNGTYVDFRGNSMLYCIQVDNPGAVLTYTEWYKDAQANYSSDCSPKTYVPDDNFEQALIDLGYDSGPLDNYVITENISSETYLNVSNKGISDLTGIEGFINLQYLKCDQNQISVLDVSKNKILKSLTCINNKITNLDLSANTALYYLNCFGNMISSINIDHNSDLKNLLCGSNQLTSIDLSNNPLLEELNLNTNLLSNVDLSKCPNLKVLLCWENSLTSINLSSNIELQMLFVNSNKLTSLDVSNNLMLTHILCPGNLIETLDVSKNLNLTTLFCNSNKLRSLNLNNGNNHNMTGDNGDFNSVGNPFLTCITVDNPSLAASYTDWFKDAIASYSDNCEISLTYIPDDNFEQALIDLGYDSGPLDDYVLTAKIVSVTNLNVSNKNISDLTGIEDFTSLSTLEFNSNNVVVVDLSKNLELCNLSCMNNKLMVLDLSSNRILAILRCQFNNLTSLILPSSQFLWQLYCNNNQLNTLTLPSLPNLKALYCYNNQISEIDLSKNLQLTNIYLYGNKLNNIDVSALSFVTILNVSKNNLRSINLSENTALTALFIDYNQIKEIDLSKNLLLTGLYCSNNQIQHLDIKANTALTHLSCGTNLLKDLDITNNKSLAYLYCSNNQLTKLDLSMHSNINQIDCSNNQLSFLNLKNGNNLIMTGGGKGLNAINNPNLFCIKVDNPENSLTNPQWFKDPQASYSALCNNIPIANAGMDQTVEEGTNVALEGSLSSDADQDNLTYKWTAPGGITLSYASPQKPTFVAPEVTQNTQFTFYLVVNDGFTDSPADQVVVTVKQVNKVPVADAGANQTAEEGSVVTLEGSLSSDADQDNLTYKWTAPAGITLSSSSAQKPTLIAPEVTQDTQFTFTLVVNDGFTDSPTSQVVITVKQVNKVPVANAGADQNTEESATVTLDGSLSSDADGDSIRYIWTAPDGIILSSASAQKPTFIAPEVTQDTQFTIYLVINDGFADSPAGQVVVTVKQVNKVPVAYAGADQNVKTGDKVVLNTSGSFDPDQDPLTYFWTSHSGITLSSASDPSPFFMAPVTKNETDLIFTLTVSDGSVFSKTDTVIITVENNSPIISVKTFFDGTIAIPEQVRYELYKEVDGNFGKYAATFSTENNTALFNVEDGNWIILSIPVGPETNFIPTYFGNSVTWSEAGIITVRAGDFIDLEINCRKTEIEPAGEYSIEGFVYQAEGTKSCVVLSNATGNNPVPGTKVLLYQDNKITPVRTTFTDNEGKYIFNNLNPADYKVIVDIPGFDQVDVWNIKLDSVSVSAVNVNFTVVTSLGVITDTPETEYKLAIYPNPTTGILYLETKNWPQNSKAEVFNYDGRLVFQTLNLNSSSVIDLSDKPDGIYILNISSNKKKETVKIVLRK